jgi:hypothetical protein
MLKITLNKSEIQTLITLLLHADYDAIKDPVKRILVKDYIKRFLKKLNNRLQGLQKKDSVFTLKREEMAALRGALDVVRTDEFGAFESNTVLRIEMFIDQKIK